MSTSPRVRDRELDDQEGGRSPKRVKTDHEPSGDIGDVSTPTNEDGLNQPLPDSGSTLPPSHALLGTAPPLCSEDGSILRIMETDVGISEYISKGVPKIGGIIKQRFTDFLVFEVDQDSTVIHIKSIDMPESSPKKDGKVDSAAQAPAGPENTVGSEGPLNPTGESPSAIPAPVTQTETEPSTVEPSLGSKEPTPPSIELPAPTPAEPWPEAFTTRLSIYFSPEKVAQLKQMFLEGPEPPFVSDAGWGGRQTKAAGDAGETTEPKAEEPTEITDNTGREEKGRGKRGRDRGRGRGRGGRGGATGGRSGAREDHRRVLSDPIASKTTRTELHQVVRELFGGKLDSETDTTSPPTEDGSRICIKWSKRGGRGGGSGGRGGKVAQGDRPSRGNFPPYIHFTMQKTNRDTQDALAYLARTIHVNVKDLSVAGTKDKRGVTVQRVALKRGGKLVEDVWKLANGVPGRHSAEAAVRERGERGVRIADLNYRKAPLELGMLKGNAFVITLRNVQSESEATLNEAMESMKHNGFINYYGMQRFGTASIPTHSIGLALLKSDWHRAISLILCERPGEHPDVATARRAWLQDGDLDRALELMPRRVVAERCILESYKKQKGETRNALGALSTIPRNLRLMYIHAYQSYVWNAIVSERIKTFGSDKPIPGDLVLENDPERPVGGDGNVAMDVDEPIASATKDEDEGGSGGRRHKKQWQAPQVKTLTTEDVDKYTIFDVVMPLPGNDVAFPGGALGEKYKEYLRRDGLNPDNFYRPQKEYSLSGSYRKILHMPKQLSWSALRYTDPDVALAQSDEDKLLKYDTPVDTPDGKFLALQIRLTLGTAAYATMALREVTKTETSSHYQTELTQASEDQQFKGADAGPPADTGAVDIAKADVDET
ncbi:pseudouridine synthase [Amylostereum chailletii]|nr:pseudouridine synthase [Amylostereum chailletii]